MNLHYIDFRSTRVWDPRKLTTWLGFRNFFAVDRTGNYNSLNIYYNFIPKLTNKNYTFGELAFQRAVDLWNQKKDIEVLWSGGIDSSCALLALLETRPEGRPFKVRYNNTSIEEFPMMYDNIVSKHNSPSDNIFPTSEEFQSKTKLIVTGECGDQIFGSDKLDPAEGYWDIKDEPWRDVYKKLVPDEEYNQYLDLMNNIVNIDEMLETIISCNKHHEIKTFQEFCWWMSFTQKWEHVNTRVPRMVSNAKGNIAANVSFYNTQPFQEYAIKNVDNHLYKEWKDYKQPAKDFIYQFVKDTDYRDHKCKEQSLIKNEAVTELRDRGRNRDQSKVVKFVIEEEGEYKTWCGNEPVDMFTLKSLINKPMFTDDILDEERINGEV